MMEQGEPPIIGLSEDTLTDIPRIGRRKMDQEPLTFPIAISKAAIWLLAGMLSGNAFLLSYLCLQSIEHGKILIRMEERAQAVKDELKTLHESDTVQQATSLKLTTAVQEMQLRQADHGWNRGK